ncbi:MAG TPA: rhodanese-like domain-containing protein [Syntrophales bacterium]|nr:rhodanese-like domain-containing protein [Syntrophales bacterium]HOM07422.1 rhodanese-like domain-containing protein [Syntrophales bacterium]HON99994.1 rhodanese-like domain-containing protein [Syntrophales bacterium]HPC01514.1 rhodanese-like domain-containing protein [Syntrophales bacterium]HPQ07063.1 rhodanese-like domain-containing protein [Syntrophales bacterium]
MSGPCLKLTFVTLAVLTLLPVGPAFAGGAEISPPALDVRALKRMIENRDPLALVHTGSIIECRDARIPSSVCIPCGEEGRTALKALPEAGQRRVVFYDVDTPPDGTCPVVAEVMRSGTAKAYVLKGGLVAWKRGGNAVESPRRVRRAAVPAVRARDLQTWKRKTPLHLVIDIRPPRSYRLGSVPGALNIPLEELHRRHGEIPRGRRLMVVDEDGTRAFLAAGYLTERGFGPVTRLLGGMEAYRDLRGGEGN